jgi:BirA family biotin operon repressor/biotin-[acetyl-CoA-carboxylase] ligase
MSLLLRPPPTLLPLMAAVAVCDVVGERAQIKWPNDIVVDAAMPDGSPALAKLAGILVEGRPQEGWAVLGIGLNVAVRLEDLPPELRGVQAREDEPAGANPSEPPRLAATLGGSAKDIEPTLAGLLEALEQRLAEPAHETLRAWRARDALHGREVAWSAGRGRAEGVDGEGRLVVALDGGGHTALGAGEVHLQPLS